MSGEPPVALADFNYRNKSHLESCYNHFGSYPKLAAWCGMEVGTLQDWGRRRFKIPVAQACYRDRGGIFGGTPETNEGPEPVPPPPAPEPETLADRLKGCLLKSKAQQTIEELADILDVSPRHVREAVRSLEEGSHLIKVSGSTLILERDLQLETTPLPIDNSKYLEQEIPLGFVADNHLGSKYERLDVLESLYDRFASYGVETVYQGGNILDGEARFNKYDIYCSGIEAQVANVVEKWPSRKGLVTMFVTGDDHEGWYVQREHIDIGRKIESEARAAGREDLVHLGYMERNLLYEQPGGSATIRVIHAGGGSAYATSYTSQKYVESIQGGEKPQIILVGHFHKFDYSFPRSVHVIQGGCTQDQTPFLRKKRIEAHVGGVVLWVKQNELGIFTSVKVEWLPYFNRGFYEYHW